MAYVPLFSFNLHFTDRFIAHVRYISITRVTTVLIPICQEYHDARCDYIYPAVRWYWLGSILSGPNSITSHFSSWALSYFSLLATEILILLESGSTSSHSQIFRFSIAVPTFLLRWFPARWPSSVSIRCIFTTLTKVKHIILWMGR